jgi:hypothetical protein
LLTWAYKILLKNILLKWYFRFFLHISKTFKYPLTWLFLFVWSALFKRSTVPTFKSYGIVQARISDCASETFSAIRTVSAIVLQHI